jgi:GNAT superfamily N-acetyltransferase
LSYHGPELLAGTHTLAVFDCAQPELNNWLTRRALANQSTGTSRTWVVTGETPLRVIAFYASCTASVIRTAAPPQLAAGQPAELPAILLARLAVDTEHQGKGLGAALLKHFIGKALQVAEHVGVRLMLVHAKDEHAKSFYQHHGFHESPIDELTLMVALPTHQ